MLFPVRTYAEGVLEIHTKTALLLFFLLANNSEKGTLATFAVIHTAY